MVQNKISIIKHLTVLEATEDEINVDDETSDNSGD